MGAAPDWTPRYHAVSVVIRPDPGKVGPTTISIRHPSTPCCFKLETPGFDIVSQYLLRLRTLSDAGKIPKIGFRFVPCGRPADETLTFLDRDDQRTSWCASYEFFRTLHNTKGKTVGGERTLVLLAALHHGDYRGARGDDPTEHDVEYRDRRGIRVVAQVDEARKKIRVTSMSAYLMPGRSVTLGSVVSHRDHCKTDHGVHCDDPVGNGILAMQDPASAKPKGSDGVVRTLKQRRPSRSSEVLNQYLDSNGGHAATIERCKRLRCKGKKLEYLNLRRSPFVRDDIEAVTGSGRSGAIEPIAEYILKPVPKQAESVRSNAAAQIKAYCNTNQLFEHLLHFGIHPEHYFASAELPLAVHYRSGMPYGPGKDGQTVNAAVQPRDWKRHQIAPSFCQSPPRLNVHYALADLSRRDREAKWKSDDCDPGRAPAIPLSIANDPRWVWHEIGHILLMATTGELEMRFSHSIGDALAAIAGDPKSAFVPGMPVRGKLAKRLHKKGCDDIEKRNRRWRGATFPWVFLPRRHDRCVTQGWSWSGAMHRPILELPDEKQPRRKGYRSEQILSTSLFRAYLCLGGATPNPGGMDARKTASEYALYLIIKALGLLGDARVVPANSPDQLVSALIDADIGTTRFLSTSGKVLLGGIAHKAIRWAFEAQGLYGDAAHCDAYAGLPPNVDVFIADSRPHYEDWGDCAVEYGAGSYVPVALTKPKKSAKRSRQPRWMTDPKKGAVSVTLKGINVEVGNRGTKKARDVSVRVFYIEWKGKHLPKWTPKGKHRWHEAKQGHRGKPTVKRVGKQPVVFGRFAWETKPKPGATYLVLAQATCPEDRANIDTKTKLPCSRGRVPLPSLVANDNNISLTLWKCP